MTNSTPSPDDPVASLWNSSLPSLENEGSREFTKEEICRLLANAWDEGVSFGWHLTELRTDENPYRKAGL